MFDGRAIARPIMERLVTGQIRSHILPRQTRDEETGPEDDPWRKCESNHVEPWTLVLVATAA